MSKIAITPAIETLLQQETDLVRKRLRNCNQIDMVKAEEAITELYALHGKPKPAIIKFDSPYKSMAVLSLLRAMSDVCPDTEVSKTVMDMFNSHFYMDKDYDPNLFFYCPWNVVEEHVDQDLAVTIRRIIRSVYDEPGIDYYDSKNYIPSGPLLYKIVASVIDHDHVSMLLPGVHDVHDSRGCKMLSDMYLELARRIDALGSIGTAALLEKYHHSLYFIESIIHTPESFISFIVTDFYRKIGVAFSPEQNRSNDIKMKLADELYMWWTFENFCIIIERPEKIDWTARYGSTPSAVYRDGSALYINAEGCFDSQSYRMM